MKLWMYAILGSRSLKDCNWSENIGDRFKVRLLGERLQTLPGLANIGRASSLELQRHLFVDGAFPPGVPSVLAFRICANVPHLKMKS